MRTLKVMNEAQFLAGEDARGVLVILEPETELTNEHLDALVARGAAGFVSDFTDGRFEKPDERPTIFSSPTKPPRAHSAAKADMSKNSNFSGEPRTQEDPSQTARRGWDFS